MEITMKQFVLFTAITLTGLSAGLFYAWQVSVIPGTKKVVDFTYLETMQSINRAILNPAFFLIFFGSLVMLCASTVQHYHAGTKFWILFIATLVYAGGTFGVTVFGNVPLNDALDAIEISKLGNNEILQMRQKYEVDWNRLHLIRTVFSVLSFLLSLAAVWVQTEP